MNKRTNKKRPGSARANRQIERILCPIDLSSASYRALPYAITLAKKFNATLLVYHCVNSLPPGGDKFMKRFLEESVQKNIPSSSLDKLDWKGIIGEGDAAEQIIEESYRQKVDLIVMQSRRRQYASMLFGSTAESICNSSPCSTLVIHEDELEWNSNGITMQPKTILAAHDFSSYSDLSLHYAINFAQLYGAQCHLLHVIPVTIGNFWVPPTEEKSKETLERLRNTISEKNYLEVDFRWEIREGQPSAVILDYARENNIDLICIGAHGESKGLVETFLFGSNADYVLRTSPCPVFVARPLIQKYRGRKKSTNWLTALPQFVSSAPHKH